MKTKLALLLVVCTVAFATPAMAQKIQALNIFPWTLGEVNVPLYPPDPGSMCLTDIVGTICEVNQDAGTLITKEIGYSGTVPYSGTISGEATYRGTVPYSGSAPFSGSVPYSGTVPFSGSAPYSGTVSYSGESYYGGPLPITVNGTVPVTTNVLDHTAVFTYAVTAPACSETGGGQKSNCCEAKGNTDGSVHLVCYNVMPDQTYWESFQYNVYREETVDIPWTYAGTANYDGYVPYSGSVPYSGEASYSGTASYSGSAEFSGLASYSGSADFSGTVPYNADYSGTRDYSGTSTFEYKEYSPTDVIYQEGNVILDCPLQDQFPTQTISFKELVTNAYVGDTIELEASGYAALEKTVTYQVVVKFAAPGKSIFKPIFKTEKMVETVNGIFKEQLEGGYKFEKPGTYQFLFKVWKPNGQLAGKAVARTVAVME